MGRTRKAIRKSYKACIGCESNISGYGTCKAGYENFYYRRGKDNKCSKCDKGKRNTQN